MTSTYKNYQTKLLQLVADCESYANQISLLKPGVSKANVGWHIAHSLMVISFICSKIPTTDPSKVKTKNNLIKWIVMTTGRFSRGKAKSPYHVTPKAEASLSSIARLALQARQDINDLVATAQPDQYFTHPIFGDLRLKQAVRFIGIHTNHHLAIIRDIVS